MAFRDDLYTADIQPRVRTYEDLDNQRRLSDDEAGFLSRYDFEGELGIIKESDGTIRNHLPEVPRIFIMQKNADGDDVMMDLDTAGIKLASREFWDQAQLGNVFAYPAGDSLPVQIQLDVSRGHNPKVKLSKPVTPATIPPAPRPPKPGFFGRIGALFSKRLQQKCNTYDAWLSDRRQNYNRILVNEAKRTNPENLKFVDKEVPEVKQFLAHRQEEENKAKNRAVFDRIAGHENRKATKENGLDNAISMWKPVPVMKDNLLKKPFYTEEEFNKLEKYEDLKLEDIKIGGQGLTDEDFASIAIAASVQPKYASKNPLILSQGGADYPQILTEVAGLSKEEAELITAASFDGSLSRDMMSYGSERGGNGQAIEAMAVPGRRDAKAALEKYNPNDIASKEDLAKIIAFGVSHNARCVAKQGGKLIDNALNFYHMTGNLTKLLDRDPDLMDLAQKAGMKIEDYKTIKAMAELDRLDTKRTEAQKTLYGSAVNGEPLDDAVKKEALKDILKANLVESIVVEEASHISDSPVLNEIYKKIKARELKAPKRKGKSEEQYEKEYKDYSEQLKEIGLGHKAITSKGKLAVGAADTMKFYLQEIYNPIPNGIINLGSDNAPQHLDAMVEEIIATDKLMSKSPAELGIQLQGMNYDGPGLIQKGKIAADAIKARENAPVQEIGVNLDLGNREVGNGVPHL